MVHSKWTTGLLVTAALLLSPALLPAAEKQPYLHKWPPADQVFDRNALPDPADKDEAGAVIRRTGALIAHLKTLPRCPSLKKEEAALAALKARANTLEAESPEREKLLAEVCKGQQLIEPLILLCCGGHTTVKGGHAKAPNVAFGIRPYRRGFPVPCENTLSAGSRMGGGDTAAHPALTFQRE
ncbi:MAG: hypothetical protein WCK89_10505 [bacterium]